MYRSILVPLDGSSFSEHALPIALGIARRHDATLHLVHVHSAPETPRYVGEHLELDSTLEAQMRESERAYLEGLAQRLAHDHNVAISVALLDGSAVADTIHDYALATGVDLMVMTTHARSGLARFWMGHVADTLVHSSQAPILLTRPSQEPSGPLHIEHEHTFSHILIPLDGSPLAEQVIDHAMLLGVPGQTAYTLLQAIDPLVGQHTHPPYEIGLEKAEFEQLRAESQRYLERIAERLRAHAARVDTRLVVAQPADAILDHTRESGVDLIAMATHGHGGLSRLLLGSVADKIVRGAETPVLLYRPAAEPGGRTYPVAPRGRLAPHPP